MVVLFTTLAIAIIDVLRLRIYNLMVYPFLLSGLVFHGVIGGTGALADSLLGLLFGFGILVPFCALGGLGGGDVKLMAAIGAWLGLPVTFAVFLAGSLVAGLYAVVLVIVHGRVRETWLNLQIVWLRLQIIGRYLAAEDKVETAVIDPNAHRRVVPFAAMVALGLFALLMWLRFLNLS